MRHSLRGTERFGNEVNYLLSGGLPMSQGKRELLDRRFVQIETHSTVIWDTGVTRAGDSFQRFRQ